MTSAHFRSLSREIKKLGKIYLNYAKRPNGDYTSRQLSSAAAYTLFCHAEFENYFENWSAQITDLAEKKWIAHIPSKPLIHLCTFHEGRSEISAVPTKDVWNAPIVLSIKKQKDGIKGNHGIKEANICRLLAPLGYDVRTIDTILLADLTAFGKLRGDYAHGSHGSLVQNAFDPFARKLKAEALTKSIGLLDVDLEAFFKAI